MNYRNQNFNQHTNQMQQQQQQPFTGNFNLSMPSRGDFGGQSQHWGMSQFPSQQQQQQQQYNPGNNNSSSQQFGLFRQEHFDYGRGQQGQFYQQSPHSPMSQMSFRQDPFNSGSLEAPLSGIRQFNYSPNYLRGTFTDSPDYLRGAFTDSPDMGGGAFSQAPRDVSFYGCNDSPQFSGPRLSRSRSPCRPALGRRGPSPEAEAAAAGSSWRPMMNNQPAPKREHEREQADWPSLGQPGGKDDPRRKNLCGSRTKWYLRYLKRGFQPDEAIRMAREPKQPAANYQRDALDVSADDDVDVKPPMLTIEIPNEEDSREANPLELRVCLVPVGYPREQLTHDEKLDLEEAILREVLLAGNNVSAPLRFSSIIFKSGCLKLDCANKASAEWLLNTAGHFSEYSGRKVVPKLGNVKPTKSQFFYVTVFLPRSVDKSDEFILGLIKSQNEHNTDLWKLQSRRDNHNGTLLVLSIDKVSANQIAANDYSIFYRYGKVPVRGLRKKFGEKSPPRSKSSKPPFNRHPKTPKPKAVKVVKLEDLKSSPEKESDENGKNSVYCINLTSDDED